MSKTTDKVIGYILHTLAGTFLMYAAYGENLLPAVLMMLFAFWFGREVERRLTERDAARPKPA